MAITGAVLFVFWLPVAVQQLTKDPGNVSQLVDFFGDHGREQRYEDAWHVLALQLGAWPDWLKGASAPSVIGTIDFSAALPVPIGLLALLGATALGVAAGARTRFVLDGIVLAVLAASFVAMTRIVGDVLTYLVKWTWALGTITWIAIAWSCVAAWQARGVTRPSARRRSQQIARVGMAALVVGVRAVVVVDTVRRGPRRYAGAGASRRAMAKLGDAAFARAPRPARASSRSASPRPRGRVLGERRCRRRPRAPRRRRARRTRARVRVRITPTRRRRSGTRGRRSSPTRKALASARVLPGYRAVGDATAASRCSSGRPEPG